MDRAVDPGLLQAALADRSGLPSAAELSDLLANAEVELLLGRKESSPSLLNTAWYLHAVASSGDSLGLYGVERQRACFQVSAHAFDLALRTLELGPAERLELCFGSQVAYIRGALTPNSVALYRRVLPEGLPRLDLLVNSDQAALAAAVALLAGDARGLFREARRVRDQVTSLVSEWGLGGINQVALGIPALVCEAAWHLLVFLVYGRYAALDRGRAALRQALAVEQTPSNLRASWIAAHLLDVSDDFQASSLWTALPPDVPDGVRRAFSMASPPALTLWPPQLDLLRLGDEEGARSILSPEVKRAFVSTPTSGGKTLLAQILLANHLATENTGVCYVAPTRALCSEVRGAIDRRLRYIRPNLRPQADLFFWDLLLTSPDAPPVEVMTPERLSFLLRQDAERVLDQFGLFVIDEVHTVGDGERGWVLEQILSFLHHRTEGGPQRILCLSASVGNRHQLAGWLDDGTVVEYHRAWRGPRRIHCVWSAQAAWDEREVRSVRSRTVTLRERFPQYGSLGIRRGPGDVVWYRTTEPVGELVLDTRRGSTTRKRNSSASTPLYRMRTDLTAHLALSGPVLVIESTRHQALFTAKAIAETQEEVPRPLVQPLLDLIEARLGTEHPLGDLVRVGVAYHHGSLPFEIRASVEDAVREGTIRCLVATATMTEGVNLPVRSVIVGSQGSYGPDGYNEYITGPRLINAVGRAGRATRETEGILILAVNQRPSATDLDSLQPDDEALRIESALMSEAALEALARFEEALRNAQDAVFSHASGIVGGFVSFVWFVSDRLEELDAAVSAEAVNDVLERSLAWQQMPEDLAERWYAVAEAGVEVYQDASRSRRSRWAKSSARPRSVNALERLSDSLVTSMTAAARLTDPAAALSEILADERLEVLSELEEFPGRKFYDSRGGRGRSEVAVDLRQLTLDWISGAELHELADGYLSSINDVDYRFEQLADFVNEYFEVFLPWLVGLLQTWVEQKLELEDESAFPSDLPALLRWGVDRSAAVTLMLQGVRSRRLAIAIATAWEEDGRPGTVLDWIRGLPQAEWEQRFEPSVLEIRSLLEVSRKTDSDMLSEVLAGRPVILQVISQHLFFDEAPAVLISDLDVDTSPVRVGVDGDLVGELRNEDRLDVRELMKLGVPLQGRFRAEFVATLTIQLEEVA